MFIGKNQDLAQALTETIKSFNANGWSPATSTNYSVRSATANEYIISRSGVDKSLFSAKDLILINEAGEVLPPFNCEGVKSSAETQIHTALYARYPEINCVLHTHSVLGTVISNGLLSRGKLTFKDLEILKGLDGNTTHETEEVLPIVPNSQSMDEIIKNMEEHFNSQNLHAFLIAGHGLYSWGKDIPSAKRHIETFEFLFKCYEKMRIL